jgi:hypothetical protein
MSIEATQTAVEEALAELGVEEPLPAIERGVAAPEGEDEDDDEGDEDSELSADALDKIDRDPKLKATYRSLVRRMREGADRHQALVVDSQQAMAALQALRANPREAARALAHVVGGRVEFPNEPTRAERARAKLAPMIGDEAARALAAPLMELAGEVAREEVAPVAGHIKQQQDDENLRAISAGIRKFAEKTIASGGEYDEEIEREMSKLVPKILPAPGTGMDEYLSMLHARVTARRGARGDDEPGRARRTTRDDDEPGPGERIRPGMDPRKAVAIAVRQAEAQLASGARGRRR